MLLAGHDGTELTAEHLISFATDRQTADQLLDTELLRSLLLFVSEERAPTLLVQATDGRQTPAETETGGMLVLQCRAAVFLAMQIPQLRLGFAVAPGTWKEHVESIPESFTKAALRENRLNVQAWSPEQVVERLRTRIGMNFVDSMSDVSQRSPSGGEPLLRRTAAAVRTVMEVGATKDLVDSLCEAIRPRESDTSSSAKAPRIDGAASDGESGRWQSAQERFLFELLNHHAQLGGLFQLNADPGFRFGNRRAEVDLLCNSLAIAIEIDGYFHFTDAECYRRDRRKDLSLQQHGFLVLRFLAEDVVPEIEQILETILAVVETRRQLSEQRRSEG